MFMSEYQNLDYLNATIVQNTWYTPFASTRNVKAWYLIVEQTNNGATNENIVVELTINGTVYTRNINNAVSGTAYYVFMFIDGTMTHGTGTRQMLSLDADQSAPLETRSLQIRVRQTTAVDPTAAQIEVNMVYATKEVS